MLQLDPNQSLAQLQSYIPPSAPRWAAESSRWAPVRHIDFAEAVLRGAERRGMRPRTQAWEVNEGGHGLVGTIQFEADDRWPKEVVPSIAVRHSNVGRHAVTIAIGAVVLVCSNGMLVGEVVLKQRHTVGLDLDVLVEEGLNRFAGSGPQTGAFIDRLRATPFAPAHNDRILIAAARAGLVPWSMLKHVDAALRDPPSTELGQPTGWSVYNAFTEAIKRRSGRGQFESLRGLSSLFSESSLERLHA
jgi:hypothetical protein